jgi:hypothetical protein
MTGLNTSSNDATAFLARLYVCQACLYVSRKTNQSVFKAARLRALPLKRDGMGFSPLPPAIPCDSATARPFRSIRAVVRQVSRQMSLSQPPVYKDFPPARQAELIDKMRQPPCKIGWRVFPAFEIRVRLEFSQSWTPWKIGCAPTYMPCRRLPRLLRERHDHAPRRLPEV